MITSFKIHEDKENVFSQRPNQVSLKNVEVQGAVARADRRVLGHITNGQNGGIAKIVSGIRGLKQKNNKVKNEGAQKCGETDSMDEEFSFIPKLENFQLLETTYDIDLDVELKCTMVNVNTTEKKYDQRLDDLYKSLYRKDIHNYLKESEKRHRPNWTYMKRQPELNDGMRCILIDWLVSISDEFHFLPETLHLAVCYLDRFLSRMSVVRNKLQLVGVTAIMIASKYEEVYALDSAHFSFLTNNTFTVKQILKMEQLMLRTLSFDLTTPTVQTFIDEYATNGDIIKEIVCMAMYIGELCLAESVDFIQYLPSEIAAASLALSICTFHNNTSPQRFVNVCGYSLRKLLPIIEHLSKILNQSSERNLQAVRIKYKKSSLCRVADIPLRKMKWTN